MRRLSIITCLSLALLAACGGGSNNATLDDQGISSSSGGSSGSGTTSATASSLTATSSVSSIPADGSASATITVLARNTTNNLISGVDVTFTASAGGGIAVTQGTTGTNGSATATLTAVNATAGTPITVTATAGSLTASVQVQVVATSGATTTSAVASLTLSTSSPTIYTDGSTTATITALALDAGNNVLSGVPVTFTTAATGSGIAGALQVSQPAVTGPAGTLTAILSAGGNTNARIITVTGTTASLSSQIQVNAVVPTTPTTPVYTMGYGTGTSFVANKICVGPAPPIGTCSLSSDLSAGGTTSLSINIVDQTGTLYNAAPVTVTFNSTCLANNQAEILPAGSSTPSASVTTSTGSVNATYVATGCSSADVVTASATVAGQSVGATATITVAAATIGSIQFVSATPPSIGLKGTGLNQTSTVIFKVTDSTGGAESGVQVSFSLDTSVGGISLSPTTATSGSDGTVQTVVSAGTVHTVVRVTASIAATGSSPALSTQSSQLTVTTGLPASGSFSIAVGSASNESNPNYACANVEGFNIDGITVPVTVRLADRYNNPVPDGTSVAFQTDGGHIDGACTTPLNTSGDGTCQVTWTSADPRPGQDPYTGAIDLTYGYPTGYTPLLAAGRAIVLASTLGEESFTDLNASGFYQTGDPFANLGEPFEDDNEQANYELGDPFIDFYQTGVYVGPSTANPPPFIGIICTGTTPSSTCTISTLAIGASHLIVMSTSGATITLDTKDTSSVFTVAAGPPKSLSISQAVATSGTVAVNVQDNNGNAMPAGSTVAWAFSNANLGVTVTALPPTVVGCDGNLGGENYGATFTSTAGDLGSGTLTVTVTTPSGSTSVFSIVVNVTA